VKLLSWNVNSVKAREERFFLALARHQPDVVCLQETKVPDGAFPTAKLLELGYHCALNGQKAYNGVALLSKTPIEDPRIGFGDAESENDPQSRFVSGLIGGVRIASVYVPNGSRVDSDKWHYKLAWLKRLETYLATHHKPDEPLLLCGDFNIAPDQRDVARPFEWEHTVLYHPEARAALQSLMRFGLVDAFRKVHEEPGLYSWWDYRNLGFQRNNGLRIDLVLATSMIADRTRAASVDRDERYPKAHPTPPSDHAPVILEWA
jgi:exodeoxyribonuclease-3